MISSITSKIAKVLQTLLTDRANELGRSSKFIERERKLTGSGFINTLLFGWLQNPEISVEGLVRGAVNHDIKISAQGLDKRFTEKAADFVKSVLEEGLKETIQAKESVNIEILKRFKNVYVADGSVITLPDELHEQWRGTGGAEGSSRSAIKLDVCLELKTGGLQCGLAQGKTSDNRNPLANAEYEAGSLRIQDLGYFNLERMKKQTERGEYWISRYQTGTVIYDEQGELIDLSNRLPNLKKAGITQYECQVELGVKTRLGARLLFIALPEEAAARGRAKMKENASNNGKTATQASLALCDWKLLIVNAPRELLSLKDCVLLYSARWLVNYCSSSGKVMANWGIPTALIRGVDCVNCTQNCSLSPFNTGYS
jgi:hypothetical protein